MALNQGFGDRLPVPTGISGDTDIQPMQPLPHETRQAFGIRTYYAELLDRYEHGSLSSEEEAELLAHFSAEVAQGYN